MLKHYVAGLALLTLVVGCTVEPARVTITASVTAREPPPPLPVYEQPPCPEEGFLWTPGYWAWSRDGYYWVPGTWVRPPRSGYLWTPGYWGWNDGIYVFHPGYWGAHVGFYGGVVYGGGYVGTGYVGGHWANNNFVYNTAVTRVNTTVIHNTYHETVINNVTINNNTVNNNTVNNRITVNNVSYSGGPNGTHTLPTDAERSAEREIHVQPTTQQIKHITDAGQNRALLAHVNQGHPAIAATPHPSAFSAPGVVAAHPPQLMRTHEELPIDHAGNNAPPSRSTQANENFREDKAKSMPNNSPAQNGSATNKPAASTTSIAPARRSTPQARAVQTHPSGHTLPPNQKKPDKRPAKKDNKDRPRESEGQNK